MGYMTKITIANLDKTRSEEVPALADTGATLTVLPRGIADELSPALLWLN